MSWALIRSRAGNAQCDDTVADRIQFLMRSLAQFLVWCLTVNGVDHHFLGLNVFDGFQPWRNIFLTRVVCAIAFHKHCLDNHVSFEPPHVLDDILHIVGWLCRAVHLADIVHVDRVELQDVIVHFEQGLADVVMP